MNVLCLWQIETLKKYHLFLLWSLNARYWSFYRMHAYIVVINSILYIFFFTICRNHSDEKAYDLEGVNWHFGHRRWGLFNHLDDHIRGSMLLCFCANFVNLPFQEGEFDPSSMLRNCQRGSGEGEKMLLLIMTCLIGISCL